MVNTNSIRCEMKKYKIIQQLRCPICHARLADQKKQCSHRIIVTDADKGDFVTKCFKCKNVIGLSAEH